MTWYIDTSKVRKELHSNGKVIIYYRCGCAICEKCWFRPDICQCIYGGPYSGYQEITVDIET